MEVELKFRKSNGRLVEASRYSPTNDPGTPGNGERAFMSFEVSYL